MWNVVGYVGRQGLILEASLADETGVSSLASAEMQRLLGVWERQLDVRSAFHDEGWWPSDLGLGSSR